jgi:hypothetical protein
MNISNLKVELEARLDKHDKLWHLGKIKFPGSIDFSNGIAILIFLSEDGDEELQIAVNDKDNSTFSKVKREKAESGKARLKIPIDAREDQYGKTFYVCKVNHNAVINCSSEVVFLIYTSKPGCEELQIVGHIESADARPKEKSSIEITSRRRVIDEPQEFDDGVLFGLGYNDD